MQHNTFFGISDNLPRGELLVLCPFTVRPADSAPQASEFLAEIPRRRRRSLPLRM
jgi:hypothetical protein